MIEGQALKDFRTLPKIVGYSDPRSLSIAVKILTKLGGRILTVSDPETAEMINLIDNYSRKKQIATIIKIMISNHL